MAEVLAYSREEAIRLRADIIGVEHLVLGMIRQGKGATAYMLLEALSVRMDIPTMKQKLEELAGNRDKNVDTDALQAASMAHPNGLLLNEEAGRLLRLSALEARMQHKAEVDTEHVLLAILKEYKSMTAKLLKLSGVNYQKAYVYITGTNAPQMGFGLDDEDEDDGLGYADDLPAPSSGGKQAATATQQPKSAHDTPVIDSFGVDMTRAAAEGKLDPVVGREKEIERLAQILSRRKKNNPVLIGEPGVGKSAIVEGLALRIVQRKVSRLLFDKRVVALDMTAVVAGTGPDVDLSLGTWFPVNYAMRNAAEDLTQFEDFGEVIAPFYESALTAMRYQDGVYGLPETQEFPVLFYREDILADLGLTPPDTWEELIGMLPTIQGNNLSVGIPYPDIATVDMSIFNSLIYQSGGSIYDEEGKKTLIDSESGVAAFKRYTSLYNDYGLPTVFDFVSRFRSGEMPIGLFPYSTYNTLVVSAPEIRNLWNFTLFPGTETVKDGRKTVNRSVHSQGLCCMMIATDDEQVKNNAWEFMKWWVSADTQVRFGREIESILGSSARYTTANTRALEQLAWSAPQLRVLKEQMAHTVGFPEIAGGYSTTRHMTNAIRRVINTKEDARETLLTYARTINEEIRIKRNEFGLEVD